MAKKRTSKAKSPATQQPQQLEAPERIKGIIGLYRGHAEQFDQDDRSQETQMWAYFYWKQWPHLLGLTLSWVTRSAPSASDEYKLRTQPREQLSQTHEAATRYLMREAVRRKLDPAALWEESRYCRELMQAWYDRTVWGRESTVLAFRPDLGFWPDILAQQRYELPTVLQQAITDGECFFAHLIAVLEIDILAAKAQTAEALLETPPEDPKRRLAYERDHLWLEWAKEIGLDSPNVKGQVRDKWNDSSDDFRRRYHPHHQKTGRGKTGYDSVRKGIKQAQKEEEAEAES